MAGIMLSSGWHGARSTARTDSAAGPSRRGPVTEPLHQAGHGHAPRSRAVPADTQSRDELEEIPAGTRERPGTPRPRLLCSSWHDDGHRPAAARPAPISPSRRPTPAGTPGPRSSAGCRRPGSGRCGWPLTGMECAASSDRLRLDTPLPMLRVLMNLRCGNEIAGFDLVPGSLQRLPGL
jgi:hypothetical protein